MHSPPRYNPEHLSLIEEYVMEQASKNTYDLEANLAALKLYQFNPNLLNMDITYTILLKALTNLPHTDFTLCKCLMLPAQMEDETVQEIINFASVLESCNFSLFWDLIEHKKQLVSGIHGFFDSIRKFVCHVVGITFQKIEKEYLAQLMGGIDSKTEFAEMCAFFVVNILTISLILRADSTLNSWVKKYGWKLEGDLVFVGNQDGNIKTKNITERIEFDNLAGLMTNCL